jgi:hypothetical protein
LTGSNPADLPRRVVQTFIAPATLFRHFGGAAPWIGPLLISVAVAALVVVLAPTESFVAMLDGATDRRGNPVTLTSSAEEIARTGRVYGVLVTLVRQTLAAFVAAGILTVLFSTLLRGEGRFRQYLAITTHVLLITALGSLVALALAGALGAEMTGVTPALLLPSPDPLIVIHRVLAGVDLFTLWALAVAGLGVSVVSPGRSWSSAAGILVGAYLLLAIGLGVAGA